MAEYMDLILRKLNNEMTKIAEKQRLGLLGHDLAKQLEMLGGTLAKLIMFVLYGKAVIDLAALTTLIDEVCELVSIFRSPDSILLEASDHCDFPAPSHEHLNVILTQWCVALLDLLRAKSVGAPGTGLVSCIDCFVHEARRTITELQATIG